MRRKEEIITNDIKIEFKSLRMYDKRKGLRGRLRGKLDQLEMTTRLIRFGAAKAKEGWSDADDDLEFVFGSRTKVNVSLFGHDFIPFDLRRIRSLIDNLQRPDITMHLQHL